MVKNKNKRKKLSPYLAVAMLPLSMSFGLGVFDLVKAEDTTSYAYISSYSLNVTEDNFEDPSFKNGGDPYDSDASDSKVGGWSTIEKESNALGMIINVGTGSSSSEDTTNSTFSNYQNTTYFLEKNPRADMGDDSKILMINSKTSKDAVNQQANKGFRSNEITLTANSYYSFSFAVKTATNGDSSVFASAYLTGIEDEDGNPLEIGYEFLTNSQWQPYQIFVATGDNEQTVTLDFYLGSNKNDYSTGAVFFDEVKMFQYSQNEFIETAKQTGYVEDNYEDLDSKETKYLITTLLTPNSEIVDESYNFDFENEITSSNTLSPSWTQTAVNNAHAQIMRLDDYNSTFAQTGYDYIGMDLSYDILNDKPNTQAMVLYAKNSGYITVESKAIDINPHQIYKITASVKVASIESGSFTLGVKENDNILEYYPSLKNSDKEYTFQSGETSGITTNATNNYTNNYQTVELYVKGHSLYKSSFNITLSLGSESTSAKGCVVIDNIKISNASYEEYENATNKVEFTSFSGTNDTNSYFNSTEAQDSTYPVKASNYTTEIEDERYNTSGVLYLYTKEMYDQMYSAYDWAGIYPENVAWENQPNNVYMMYNSTKSYQSLTSSELSLTKNSYQKISFDYYTLKDATITVQVLDSNGITLFEKSANSESRWSKFEVVFHTAETVSNEVTLKIMLGTEENKTAGYVYLDNIILEDSTEEEYGSALNKNDFSDYYLSFETDKLTGDVQSSSTTTAYTFSIDEALDGNDISNQAVGGLVNGKNNIYGIENDLNLLVLKTILPSSATIKSAFSIDFEADKYYKLTFDLKTFFPDAKNVNKETHECDYGVSVSIDGFDVIKNLTADDLTTFTIYLNSTTASTTNFIFSIKSDCQETVGVAALTNIDITETTQAEFKAAVNDVNYENTVFQSNYISSEDDATEDDDTSEDVTEEPAQTTTPWLMIGSIIMALAMIIAILAFFLRKIKFKKKDKIQKSKYDRKISIDQNLVVNEAKRRRDEQLNELFNAKKNLIEEKKTLEEQHKFFVQEARLNNKGKITKDTEREFKSYASKMNKIDEKLNILEEQITIVSSPEHLIDIEKDVTSEEEYRLKQERKVKIVKEDDKSNKKEDK